jgi:Protein of unknown function (DUF2752)
MKIVISNPAKRTALAFALVFGTAVALVLFFFDPLHAPIYPVCLFHRLTGLNCPGCGSLRALHELLHGHFAAALHFNPLLILSLPFLGWGLARLAWLKSKGETASFSVSSFWAWIFLASVIVFGVLRNLPVAPFNSFAI